MAGARMHPPLNAARPLSPNVKPGTVRPSTRRAVLYSVNGAPQTDPDGNQGWPNPSMGSVFIEDHLPARSGYTLPANFGPVYAAGVTRWNTGKKGPNGKYIYLTVTGPYVCDPTKMVGGSWVLADMETKSIVGTLQGTSSVAPNQIAQGVAGHNHTGQNDSMGNQMGQPIGTDEHQTNPNASTTPIVSGTPTFTLTDVGQTTFDATCSFTLDQTSANTWLSKVLLYLVKQGGTAPTPHTKAHQFMPPAAGGLYTPVISGIPFFRDTGWDVYVAYQDLGEIVGTPVLVGTIPFTAISAPIQTGSPSFIYTDAGNVSFDARFKVQLDTGINQCMVQFFLVRHGDTAPDIQTTVHTAIPSNTTGLYNVTLKNCTSNVAGGLDIYAAYKDFRNSMSAPTLIGTMASNPSSFQSFITSLSGTIDAQGDILNVEFPGTAISKTGGLIHVGNNVTSSMAYPLVSGQLIELSVELSRVPT
jgi:hypothetical protein